MKHSGSPQDPQGGGKEIGTFLAPRWELPRFCVPLHSTSHPYLPTLPLILLSKSQLLG